MTPEVDEVLNIWMSKVQKMFLLPLLLMFVAVVVITDVGIAPAVRRVCYVIGNNSENINNMM